MLSSINTQNFVIFKILANLFSCAGAMTFDNVRDTLALYKLTFLRSYESKNVFFRYGRTRSIKRNGIWVPTTIIDNLISEMAF